MASVYWVLGGRKVDTDVLGKGDGVLGLGNTGLTRDGEWVAL